MNYGGVDTGMNMAIVDRIARRIVEKLGLSPESIVIVPINDPRLQMPWDTPFPEYRAKRPEYCSVEVFDDVGTRIGHGTVSVPTNGDLPTTSVPRWLLYRRLAAEMYAAQMAVGEILLLHG